MKKAIITFFVFCVFTFQLKAQLITEDFNYTGAMTSNGWTGNNTTAPINTTTPGLVYSIYSGSNVGNAASIVPGTSNQYVTKSFTLPASGDLYYAAMINVPTTNITATTGDFVLAFFQNNASRGRLFVQNQAGGGFKLAVAKTSSTTAPAYSTTIFSAGTTHLVVVKYSIVSGTVNDSVSLYVDPVINGVENGLVYSSNTDAGSDLGSSPTLQISQRINLPSMTIDGIRLSTSWAEILSPSNTNYYYKGSGDLKLTTNWGTNLDGSGSNPANFTTASQSFNIANTTTVSLSGTWSVSGANSKIIIPIADTLKAVGGGTIGSSTIDVSGAFTTDNFTFPIWGNVSGSILIDNVSGINVGGAAIITLPSFLAGGDFILMNGDVNMGNNDLTVNGKLQISGNNKFYGAGAFTLASTGTLRIGNASGISSGATTMTGAIQMTTSRYFDPAASYTYIGTGSNLITGDGLPQTITGTLSIRLTNSTDVVSLSQSIIGNAGAAVYPTISLINGLLKLGNNNIIMSSMINGSALSYVITDGTGTLTRPVSNTGGSSALIKNFYLGTTSEYRRIGVTFPSTIGTPTTTNVVVRYVSGNPGSNGYSATSGIVAHSTTGSWKLGFSVAPTNTYTLEIETAGMTGATTSTTPRIIQRVASGTNAWDVISANAAATISGSVVTETLVAIPSATTYDIALGFINSGTIQTLTEYYIDAVNGDDTNPGTILLPLKNISKINSLTFVPGNKIYLKSGCTWSGQRLTFLGSGTLNNPIVINKYGTGANPILAGNGLTGTAVVYLYNQQYIEINNLEITNSPNGPINTDFFVGLFQNGNNPLGADRRGVMVAIDNYGTANHIYLKNLNIHHIKGQLGNGSTTVNGAIPKRTGGIYFTVLGNTEQTATKSRFNDILIDSCNINYCENTGLAFDNEWNVYYPGGNEYNDWYSRRFTNVKVSNNVIHHIGKNAMIIRCTDETGLIERNVCYETAVGTTGNTMFTARAKGTVFQYNEGYLNRATTQNVDPGNIDGSMYDPDFGSVGIIFQYSYSHDNSQGLYWGCNTRGSNNNTSGIPDPEDVGCTARYNISQNDLGDLVYFNYSSAGNEIYNNVFYIKSGTSPNIIHENSGNAHTYNFRNNIIYNLSSATSGADYAFGSGPSAQYRTIQNNVFYGNHPVSEPSDANKLTTDPLFVNPGSGGLGLNSVNGYKLQSSSPCINTGMLVPNHATKDFWGNIVPAIVGQNPDRGAFEYSAPVPVVLINFQGTKIGNSNKLTWTTTSEINNVGFQLQRSADGVIFSDLAFVPTQTINGNSIRNLNYSYIDIIPFSGNNFYRLKMIDKDGKQSFSTVVALKNSKQNFSSISVYPNPIVGNQLSLMLQNIHSGNYDLYLLDMTSRKIPLQNITHSGNDGVIQIKFGNNISKGIYRLVMIGENETLNTPVIIQ